MGKRILVVDDQEAIAWLNREILIQAGNETDACTAAAEGLQKLAKNEYDVLVTDLNLGGRADGYILACAAKLARPNTLVLLVTGYPDLEGAWRTIQLQVDQIMLKPVGPAEIVQAVQRHGHVRPELLDLAGLMERYREELIEAWLKSVEEDPIVARVQVKREERIDHVGAMLSDIVMHLRHRELLRADTPLAAARAHGGMRQRAGYTMEAVFRESSHIRQVILRQATRRFLELSPEGLMDDLFTVNASVDESVLQSVRVFGTNA